ncbi:MAG: hypothetical protein AB200_02830 [Parcubacteria bacterium C7867-005]|nr:MAG: hypothetical protein AB200_02830 [Parcubacteria bacterium C7867-005]
MSELTKTQKDKYRKRVYKVLLDNDFVLGEKEKEIIEKRISNGRRYFFMVCRRKEGSEVVDRFIKIPVNNTKKLLLPFERQIEFAKYVKQNKVISTRGIIESNADPKKGVPFVIMETFPTDHSKIGFIEGNDGAELLGEKEAEATMRELLKIHEIQFGQLPQKLKKILVKKKFDLDNFRKHLIRDLNKKVLPLDAKNKRKEAFYKIIEKRLGITDIKNKINQLFKSSAGYINTKENKGSCLYHGDMAPNNLYVFDSGDVELLDLEWVGVYPNKAIAMVFDFGNLHSRAWKSKTYQRALEKILIEYYQKKGNRKLGEVIVSLSILRSHLHHSSYFENYPWDKQKTKEETTRRNLTEQDVLRFL